MCCTIVQFNLQIKTIFRCKVKYKFLYDLENNLQTQFLFEYKIVSSSWLHTLSSIHKTPPISVNQRKRSHYDDPPKKLSAHIIVKPTFKVHSTLVL